MKGKTDSLDHKLNTFLEVNCFGAWETTIVLGNEYEGKSQPYKCTLEQNKYISSKSTFSFSRWLLDTRFLERNSLSILMSARQYLPLTWSERSQ